jgi:predicted glycoside hydrolase/deacetylase ChbG (UPF0249 family)
MKKHCCEKKRKNHGKKFPNHTHFHVHKFPEVVKVLANFAYALGSPSFLVLRQEQKILFWRGNKQAVGG